MDETASKSHYRKNYRKILEEYKKSDKIHLLIFDKFDRSSRSLKDWSELAEVVKKDERKQIHFTRDNKVLHSNLPPSEKLFFNILAALSENYIDNMKQDSKKGTDERLLCGWPPFKVGFGYKNIILASKRRVVDFDDNEKPFLTEMFQLALKGGYSYSKIREIINSKLLLAGIKPFRSKSSIEQILKNPFYYGFFMYDGKLYKGSYAGIITKKEYDLIQKNMRGPNKSGKWKKDKLLNGVLKCGHCGLSVCGDRKIKKNKHNTKIRQYVYYRCSHYKQKCTDPYIEETSLFELFEGAVENLHIDDELFERIKGYLLKAHQAKTKQYNHEKPIIQRRVNDLEALRSKAYEDKLKGLIEESFFNKQYNEWTNQITQLKEQLDSIQMKNEKILHRSVLTFELANQARNLYKTQIPEEKSKFIKMLLSNVLLKDGKLSFEYKKP
ncbi:recombinase family protein, partial [bacterium]|nr:recombinase family protein [bacterium]